MVSRSHQIKEGMNAMTHEKEFYGLGDGPEEEGHDADCEPFYDMDGSVTCSCPGRPCEAGFEMGPRHDPYGVSCELTVGDHEAQRKAGRLMEHLGVNPLPGPGEEPQYVIWRGGGYAAGDPLPIRERRYLDAAESAELRAMPERGR